VRLPTTPTIPSQPILTPSPDVASEIIDALVATHKHEILILTRKVRLQSPEPPYLPQSTDYLQDPPTTTTSGVTYAKTSYTDVDELAGLFDGYHTVLSFLAPYDQAEGIKAQKNIIDACLKAGVKRFAPSEWVSYVSLFCVLFWDGM
jgi:hypothetical protein